MNRVPTYFIVDLGKNELLTSAIGAVSLKIKGLMSDDDFITYRDKLRKTVQYLDIEEIDNTVIPDVAVFSQKNAAMAQVTTVSPDVIRKVILPKNLTALPSRIFQDCHSLQSVEIPPKVTSLGEYCAFCNCYSLKTISLPIGVTSIPGSTFYDCRSLESIYIPSSVKIIEAQAFFKLPANCKVFMGTTTMAVSTAFLKSNCHPNLTTMVSCNCFYSFPVVDRDIHEAEYHRLIRCGCGESIPARRLEDHKNFTYSIVSKCGCGFDAGNAKCFDLIQHIMTSDQHKILKCECGKTVEAYNVAPTHELTRCACGGEVRSCMMEAHITTSHKKYTCECGDVLFKYQEKEHLQLPKHKEHKCEECGTMIAAFEEEEHNKTEHRIIECEICHETFPQWKKSMHLLGDAHKKIKCICGESIDASLMKKHKETKHAPVECSHCHLKYDPFLKSEHEKEMHKEYYCDNCKEWVQMWQKQEHENIKHLTTICLCGKSYDISASQPHFLKCPLCRQCPNCHNYCYGQLIYECECGIIVCTDCSRNHILDGVKNENDNNTKSQHTKIKCIKCEAMIYKPKMEEHLKSHGNTECPKCKAIIPFYKLAEHLNSEDHEAVRCECGDYVEMWELETHTLLPKHERLICRCGETISAYNKELHEKKAHSISECYQCGDSVEAYALDDHKKSEKHSVVECPKCHKKMQKFLYSGHIADCAVPYKCQYQNEGCDYQLPTNINEDTKNDLMNLHLKYLCTISTSESKENGGIFKSTIKKHCPYSIKGCTFVYTSKSEIVLHLEDSCIYVPMPCKHLAFGCTKFVPRGFIDLHLANCSYKPECCDKCEDLVPIRSIKNHKAVCGCSFQPATSSIEKDICEEKEQDISVENIDKLIE